MKTKPLLLFFCLLFAGLDVRAGEPEVGFQSVNEAAKIGVRDRLLTSLFFRGELADSIIGAGMAGSLADLDGIETNAGARAALLDWIRRNPDKAAEIYFQLKDGRPATAEAGPRTDGMRWEYNPKFIELVKALNAAARNSAVSPETLELASRRLYEGEQYGTGTPAVAIGAGAGPRPRGGGNFFSINYADYRLNESGLKREITGAGAWLEAARGPAGRGPEGVEPLYAEAVGEYGTFVAAAASVKGRKLITASESRGLEALRAGLRRSLATLSLGMRSAELAAMAASLRGLGAQPGVETLLDAVSGLKLKLETEAARAREAALKKAGSSARNGEDEFAALYLRYSAYVGLRDLKRAAAVGGFSCLYDYVAYRYLAACFPASAYPAARALLASSAGELEGALERTAEGDAGAALSSLGPKAGAITEASRLVRKASSFNRGAQFFLWGFIFRPFEFKLSSENGRPAFLPAFTLFEVMQARSTKRQSPAP